MITSKDTSRRPHRGLPDNRGEFACAFVRGRLVGFAKDMKICLRGQRKKTNRGWELTHAYFPALMSCCGMLEYLAQLRAGRTRGVGNPDIATYALKYLPQPDYNADIIRILFDAFRDSIAHRGIASGVWVDQNPATQGRRLTWNVHEDEDRPSIEVVAKEGVLTADPPWPCRYTHRVQIHLGRLWRDIHDSAHRYEKDIVASNALQDRFFRCMELLYPR
jgi:hypothetical protein